MNDITTANTYSGREAAEILGKHYNTITAMVKRGELEQVIVGSGPRGRRITRASVAALLDRQNAEREAALQRYGVA